VVLASVTKLVRDFGYGVAGTAVRRAMARIGSAEENSRESIVIAQLSVLGDCVGCFVCQQ
jgi:hypothetical protein